MAENNDFLSFLDYLKSNKIKVNKLRFENDVQYRAVLYNRYHRRYLMYCKSNKLNNDAYKYHTEIREYERRIRDYKEK